MDDKQTKAGAVGRRGRPRATTREAIATRALEMFESHGFEETSMDDIAHELGVSRKTLFNYFPTKSDIVWSDFEREFAALRDYLGEAPSDVSTLAAIADGILASLRLGPTLRHVTRAQARLIDTVTALHGHVATRGRRWADTIAAFIAEREGMSSHDIIPQMLGRCFWTAMFVGIMHWAESDDAQPEDHVRRALDVLVNDSFLR